MVASTDRDVRLAAQVGRKMVERNHGITAVEDDVTASIEFDGHLFRIDDGVGFMAVLVDRIAETYWLSTDTFRVLFDGVGGEDLTAHVLNDIEDTGWASGMRYLVQDGGKYTEQAKAAIEADAVEAGYAAEDPLTVLERDAKALLVQAAQLNAAPSQSQIELFAQRLADVRSRYAGIAAQLHRVGETVDLAGVAVMDAID